MFKMYQDEEKQGNAEESGQENGLGSKASSRFDGNEGNVVQICLMGRHVVSPVFFVFVPLTFDLFDGQTDVSFEASPRRSLQNKGSLTKERGTFAMIIVNTTLKIIMRGLTASAQPILDSNKILHTLESIKPKRNETQCLFGQNRPPTLGPENFHSGTGHSEQTFYFWLSKLAFPCCLLDSKFLEGLKLVATSAL
jgi:hypothetical protein